MQTATLRHTFLDFFATKQHQLIASSSLIPHKDPSLLFTNAGMVQFKEYFLGQLPPPCKRIATVQRCVRAGGKHNDLENVGYTARHHTFFEMLGNFSFGDYFKAEAIRYCWEFLTEVLELPADKFWITVHHSDDEAASIWIDDIGIDPERLSRLDQDNFWQMGETGPCGPCSEVFYDQGELIEGEPPGIDDGTGARYVEIWNLVFMQYELQADGSRSPLPQPCVDTGMGLERMAAVMQSVQSNYDIDLFQTLLHEAAQVTGSTDLKQPSLKVITDHIRSSSFLIADGVKPSNEGRGYVLRRIIRRALRHGHKLGVKALFFYRLVKPLVAEMGAAYPELSRLQDEITQTIKSEEEQFYQTLNKGLIILEDNLLALDSTKLPGALIFKLHDTYGFPVDLVNDIARERGLTLDLAGYDACMQEQRRQARTHSLFEVTYEGHIQLEGTTEFSGYDNGENNNKTKAVIRALIDADGNQVDTLNGQGSVVLDQTPFYAEAGGQVGDSGYLKGDGNAVFQVSDCQLQQGHHLHLGQLLSGSLQTGKSVSAEIDTQARQAIAANHSVTHLLHAALRHQLGDQVLQKGSLIDAQKLRFDFSYNRALSKDELQNITEAVNQKIRANTPVTTAKMPMQQAIDSGAIALFGEKYGEQVRVISMSDEPEPYSVELCGGTHVRRTGDIGPFSIVMETGIAAGVRRIEAVTANQAVQETLELKQQARQLRDLLKVSSQELLPKVQLLMEQHQRLQQQNEQLQWQLASHHDISGEAEDIGGIKVLLKQIPKLNAKGMRQLNDQLKDKLKDCILLLASVDGNKVTLVAGASKKASQQVSAASLVSFVAEHLGGKGGGRADMAQGGGNQPDQLAATLELARSWIKDQLATPSNPQ